MQFSTLWRACAAVLLFFTAATGSAAETAPPPTPAADLIAEALRNSPDLAAARARQEAAAARVAPAGALDDPMLETGIVNAPLADFNLRREEMTMQMLGLGQRLPFPGKRALRSEAARREAAAQRAVVGDARDRLVRDVRTAYEELAATDAEAGVLEAMRVALQQFVGVAQARYSVGGAGQTDVLQVTTQLARVRQQQFELASRRVDQQSALDLLVGREAGETSIVTAAQALEPPPSPLAMLVESGRHRPRAAAVDAERASAESRVALMRREYYPDFDVKLTYGRRQRAQDGMPRDDMVSVTVGVNLPIWRRQRLEPQVAEARAMLRERESMLRALQLETSAALATRHAVAVQARRTVELLDGELLPAADAAVYAAFAAYRVGRVDFSTLVDARLRLLEAQTSRIAAVSEHNRAVADIDYLAGRVPAGTEELP